MALVRQSFVLFVVVSAAVGSSSACEPLGSSQRGESTKREVDSARETIGGNGGNAGSALGGSNAAGSTRRGSSGAGNSEPRACGNQTCASNQICIRPCCGGPAPRCTPRPQDGGQCPPGMDAVSACPGSSRAGCRDRPCTPRAPFCADVPAACGAALTCPCLGNVCGQGTCGLIHGRTAICMCA